MASSGDGFKPTRSMRAEAARALAWRREHGRGGVAVGVARARDLANGRDLSLDTAKRMRSFFARHEVDRKATGWRPGEKGFPSAGRVAWGLWGGDSGRAWANKVVARHEARQRVAKTALAVIASDHTRSLDVVEIAKLSTAQRLQRKNAASRSRKASFARRHRRDIAVALTTAGLLASTKLMASPSARDGFRDSIENPSHAVRRGVAAVGATKDTLKPKSIRTAVALGARTMRRERKEQRLTGRRQPWLGSGLMATERTLTGTFRRGYRKRLPAEYKSGRRRVSATPPPPAPDKPKRTPKKKVSE